MIQQNYSTSPPTPTSYDQQAGHVQKTITISLPTKHSPDKILITPVGCSPQNKYLLATAMI